MKDATIRWVMEASVDADRIDELRALMGEMSTAVRDEEPGCLQYDWYLGDGEANCHFLEAYADDAAILRHVDTLNQRFARRLFGLIRPLRFTVYGTVGEAARAALAPLAPRYLDRP